MLDPVSEIARHAVDLQAERNVLGDRLWEGVGFLEHHADPPANLDWINLVAVQILRSIGNLALHDRACDEIVHPVETTDKRALPATARPDERRDLTLRDLHRHVSNGLHWAVMNGNVLSVEDDVADGARLIRFGASGAHVRNAECHDLISFPQVRTHVFTDHRGINPSLERPVTPTSHDTRRTTAWERDAFTPSPSVCARPDTGTGGRAQAR